MEVALIVKRVFERGRLCFELPHTDAARERLKAILQKCDERHGGFVSLVVGTPRKRRTTGEKSQNRALNGFIYQICEETGNDFEAVKYCVKMTAVEKLGFPYTEISGHILPKRERDCSTEECAKLIEAARYLAADLNITLREGSYDELRTFYCEV